MQHVIFATSRKVRPAEGEAVSLAALEAGQVGKRRVDNSLRLGMRVDHYTTGGMMYVVLAVDMSERHWDSTPPSVWQGEVFGPFESEEAAETWAGTRWSKPDLRIAWKAMPVNSPVTPLEAT